MGSYICNRTLQHQAHFEDAVVIVQHLVTAKHRIFVTSRGKLLRAHHEASFLSNLGYERSPKTGMESLPSIQGNAGNEIFRIIRLDSP